jgi:hypothetical protein
MANPLSFQQQFEATNVLKIRPDRLGEKPRGLAIHKSEM